jgi:hypothetical protein
MLQGTINIFVPSRPAPLKACKLWFPILSIPCQLLTHFVSIGSRKWSCIRTLVLFFPHVMSVWNESPKSDYTALLVFLSLESLFLLQLVCQLENVSCLLHACIPCDHTHFATQWFVISTELIHDVRKKKSMASSFPVESFWTQKRRSPKAVLLDL